MLTPLGAVDSAQPPTLDPSKRGAGLKVGIDSRLMGENLTGIGHYVTELSRELDRLLPAAQFFLYAPWPIGAPVDSPRWRTRIDPWGPLFERFRGSWATKHVWMLLRAGALCARDRVNVFWATQAPLIPNLPRGVRLVATVYDLGHRTVPQAMRRTMVYGHRFLERRLSRADALLVISEGTARKLWELAGYKADAVARPAVSGHFRHRPDFEVHPVLRRYGISGRYLLTIANCKPHKNIDLLISVFLSLKNEGRLQGYTLVLGGNDGDQLLARLRRAGERELNDVIALGYVPDSDLPALYSGAEVFVLPSLNEGFGMPVLEARACQTKIVTTDMPEIREAGGDRAIYVTPDAAGIRQGILAALAAERPSAPDNLWTWRSSARVLADAIDPPR